MKTQLISVKSTKSQVTPTCKDILDKCFLFFLREMTVPFGELFSQSSKVSPGQSKLNIILLSTKEIFVELMDMDTKHSLEGNFTLLF